MQFAGSHLPTSLLSFNIGVELGQLLVLILLIPALQALFRFVVAERMGTIILSALVAHTGWHWMLERGAILGRFQPPDIGRAFLAGALRWLIAILILAGAIRLVLRKLRTRSGTTRRPKRNSKASSIPRAAANFAGPAREKIPGFSQVLSRDHLSRGSIVAGRRHGNPLSSTARRLLV